MNNAYLFALIEFFFVILFVVILIDVKKKKNIGLAVNALIALILICSLKIFLMLWVASKNLSMCDFAKKVYCN